MRANLRKSARARGSFFLLATSLVWMIICSPSVIDGSMTVWRTIAPPCTQVSAAPVLRNDRVLRRRGGVAQAAANCSMRSFVATWTGRTGTKKNDQDVRSRLYFSEIQRIVNKLRSRNEWRRAREDQRRAAGEGCWHPRGHSPRYTPNRNHLRPAEQYTAGCGGANGRARPFGNQEEERRPDQPASFAGGDHWMPRGNGRMISEPFCNRAVGCERGLCFC